MTTTKPDPTLAQKKEFRRAYRSLFNKVVKMKGSHIMVFVVADPTAPTDHVAMNIYEGTGPHVPEADSIEGTSDAWAKNEPDALDHFCAHILAFIAEHKKHHQKTDRPVCRPRDTETERLNDSI